MTLPNEKSDVKTEKTAENNNRTRAPEYIFNSFWGIICLKHSAKNKKGKESKVAKLNVPFPCCSA